MPNLWLIDCADRFTTILIEMFAPNRKRPGEKGGIQEASLEKRKQQGVKEIGSKSDKSGIWFLRASQIFSLFFLFLI